MAFITLTMHTKNSNQIYVIHNSHQFSCQSSNTHNPHHKILYLRTQLNRKKNGKYIKNSEFSND